MIFFISCEELYRIRKSNSRKYTFVISHVTPYWRREGGILKILTNELCSGMEGNLTGH